MRLRHLLATLGPRRRESSSSIVGHRGTRGGVARAGLGLAATKNQKYEVEWEEGGAGGREDEEDGTGVFRASQEQQTLVFVGKREVSGVVGRGHGAGGREKVGGGGCGGGLGAFHTFAYNNYHR